MPPAPTVVVGSRPARDSRSTARACARLAAATRRSVFAVSACFTRSSSKGSPNRLHHAPGGCSPEKAGDLPASRKGACDGAAGTGET
ncbi:hypothetical protein [Sphingopyxis sp. PET50]|uniref:hypothetical protein n=1 Tax=Sphingopyxis sp. PET50 TaxID=2976533 RepID=UPI0028A63C7F|nr:hypothetical protein [Sphingopyxis sp. PET50]